MRHVTFSFGQSIGVKPVPFVRDLATHGDRTALITPMGEILYRELAERVTVTARRLGSRRRLVLLAGANTADALIGYLAALAAGHVVLLAPGDSAATVDAFVTAYDPDVVVRPADGTCLIDERRTGSAHTLHPDLALLLSTSGSTGSPKLVRLSHENLQANAESIATYLDIRDSDRAATTLPMHYCYGLSVIHSHLLRGAALILTDLSVADPCFWERFRAARGSAFAGVPYTFDLLDRAGFATMDLPHLRYVTQAGGRLAPDRVARYAALGRRAGWDLFVMYGQTEATARMAYLPPALAATHPHAIGVPVPGGSFRIEPAPGHPVGEGPADRAGELVYTGPNVMLGYAETPADLRLGRTVDELRTGDIARLTDDGLYEVIGRSSRFVKIYGLRIDLQRAEAALERQGIPATCTGDDHELVVAVTGTTAPDAARVRRLTADECGLPLRAVRVHHFAELPRLATGKPDYRTILREARAPGDGPLPTGAPVSASASGVPNLCRLYAEILDRSDVTEDSTFVGLGGDSLSYVEMSLRIEQALGHLPTDWHLLPIRELRPPARRRPGRRLRALETGVALRAVAIVLIVGSHIPVFMVQGGAHVLLGVAGFNFARFHLTSAPRRERVRHISNGVARIAVPSIAWIALVVLLGSGYDLENAVLLNSVLGSHEGRQEWHYWFVETIVYFLVALTLFLSAPAVDRAERRFPFGLPAALAALGLLTRYNLPGFDLRVPHLTPVVVFWLFALGWAAAKASTVRHRLLVTAAIAASVPGLFPHQHQREAVVIAGLALLVWFPTLPSTRALNRVAGVLAGSSLYIYLTHWQVFPYLKDRSPLLALVVSLVVGIGYATVATRLMRTWPRAHRPGRRDRPTVRRDRPMVRRDRPTVRRVRDKLRAISVG
ncbi:AMP-binding protein [Streptomyces roseifaciens]|uniref:AMP-binding protein n=1 Tax=Streptomyces roseifaciens TaxID=1488406 RepID=UPI0007C77862|nr:AMP-binding protein [Streptomyces roseifaciens]